MVGMASTDGFFVQHSETSNNKDLQKYALAIANRLAIVTGVPISRFDLVLPSLTPGQQAPNPGSVQPAVACKSSLMALYSPEIARYAEVGNTSFLCQPLQHTFSVQAPAPSNGQEKTWKSTVWEVVVEPPTWVDGDTDLAIDVANGLVHASAGNDPLGNHRHHANLYALWFPGTQSGLSGQRIPPSEANSVVVGVNPGMHLIVPPGTKLPQDLAMNKVREADDVNMYTLKQLQDLWVRLSKAAQAHQGVMSFHPYQPPTPGPSGPLSTPPEEFGGPPPDPRAEESEGAAFN
jgi:hypothetical protein